MTTAPGNDEIAQLLDRIAELLAVQEENPYRVTAYRRGAETVRNADTALADLSRAHDIDALKNLPDIGQALASTVMEYVNTGRSGLLDRLERETDPGQLFAQLPGIGPELARRIVSELDIDSLEELERAAHDGRLAQIEGFGPGRVGAVRDTLAGRLSRAAQRRSRQRTAARNGNSLPQPDVATLFDVDAEYRRQAEAGQLRRIAPRRFNPAGVAWLPILNTKRNGWSFTVLFSNTARAHELGTTHDWVVIYFEQDGRAEDQCTVVTERQGALVGQRVIRGREAECRDYYEAQ
jgi:DNA polymerase (family 10)